MFVCIVASIQVGYASSIEHPRDSERMVATVSAQLVDHYVSAQDISAMQDEKCIQGKKNGENSELSEVFTSDFDIMSYYSFLSF